MGFRSTTGACERVGAEFPRVIASVGIRSLELAWHNLLAAETGSYINRLVESSGSSENLKDYAP